MLGLGIAAGYGWVIWSSQNDALHSDLTPCLFKNSTGIACPSCGSTRSVLLLSQGYFSKALLLNPLGILMALIMVIVPFWLLYDIILNKDTLYYNYKKAEDTIRIKWVAISLILLIILNWLWNIQKGL